MNIFLYIINLIVPSVILSLIDIFVFLKIKNTKTIIGTVIKDFFYVNLTTFAIVNIFIRESNILFSVNHSPVYYGKFFGISIGICAVYLILKFIFNNIFTIEKIQIKRKGLALTARIISAILVFIGTVAFTGTIWGKSAFYDVNPDQMLVTLLSPTTGTDNTIMITAIEGPVLISICVTFLFCILFFPIYNIKLKDKIVLNDFARRIIAFVLAVTVLIGGIVYGVQKFELEKLYLAYTDDSPFIKDNYRNPNDVKMQFPEKKRNLIHIYLESIENSYFTEELGGFMEENLMPNLAELSKDGINFSNKGKGEGYGGPLKTYGATWSVASMVNQFFGFPMKVPVDGNSYGTPGKFFPGAVGLGDILHDQGYEQTMMIGADATFGGLEYMFHDHGNFKIMDYKYAKMHHTLPTDDYNVAWGYEDEKLYKFAQEELTRLANTGKPFHFIMENADSHFPGFAFEDGEPVFQRDERPVDYGKTISFSEKHLTEFVRWIQKQPFYENTTVVLIGDHLTMDRVFFKEHPTPKGYWRTTYNLILNPSKEVANVNEDRLYNRKWASYDMYPTLLAAIGVKIDGDRLGIGTNLFSDEKTIYEKDGYYEVNAELERKSNFYNEHFLLGKTKFNNKNISVY